MTTCFYEFLKFLFDIIFSLLKTIAHELGHNLGMFHDFESDGKERFSSNSILCTGIGGYMDYGPNFNRWSECSVEDFTKYYNSYPDWCLASR